MNNFSRSIKSYQKALETDPSNIFAKLGIGNIHELQGEFDQALTIYTEILETATDLGGFADNVAHVQAEHSKATATHQ